MGTEDLGLMENKILQSYKKDGMLESLMGLALLGGGLNLVEHVGGAIGLLAILVILLGRAWRRRITYPRLGYAEILSKQKKEKRTVLLLALLVVVAMGALALIASWNSEANRAENFLTSPHAQLFFGGLTAVMIALVAAIRKVPQFYFVAVFLFALIITTDSMNMSGGYALAITGAILMVIGLVKLILFVRANPKLEGHPAHE